MKLPLNRVLGAILLVSGTCIGAGMLGMPVLTGAAGFMPSVVAFTGGWLFMLLTGLLLLEVNLAIPGDVSIISMAGRTLGRWGQAVSWVTFLYLFYCLMVGYVAESGRLVALAVEDLTHIDISSRACSIACVILLGTMVYLGARAVDVGNRVLMAGLVLFYLILLYVGYRHVNLSLLQHVSFPALLVSLPAMVISFGYHNMVPSITTYLERNRRALIKVFAVGSIFPLIAYLLWEGIILGLVPVEGEGGFKQALRQQDMVVYVLRRTVGAAWVVEIVEYFSLCAIVTSFLGVALSLVDFLADGLGVRKTASGRFYLVCLALLPPTLFAFSSPQLFLTALRYAGGFGAVVLFGILPSLMAWRGRYHLKLVEKPILAGGKPLLAGVLVVAVGIFILQLALEMGWVSRELLGS